MAKGPGYTVNDLAYWSGFIGGTACTNLALLALPAWAAMLEGFGLTGWGRIVTLVVSVVVGVAVGVTAEYALRAYQKSTRPPKDQPPESF